MHFHVITLFPELVGQITSEGVLGRAIKQGIIGLTCWNPRDFSHDRHRTVDDRPYGGGPGMVMQVQPLRDTLHALRQAHPHGRVIYLSPQGQRFTQQKARELADCDHLVLVCGRYEGVDERFIDTEVDEELSVGDYVLSGGELPALIVMDAVTRLLPGALGDAESAQEDSFMDGLLDYPHFTRPEVIDGRRVPEPLLGGNHAVIRRWRAMQALGRTWQRRPELLEAIQLDEEQQALSDYGRTTTAAATTLGDLMKEQMESK